MLGLIVILIVLAVFAFMIAWNLDNFSKSNHASYLFWVAIYIILSLVIIMITVGKLLEGAVF